MTLGASTRVWSRSVDRVFLLGSNPRNLNRSASEKSARIVVLRRGECGVAVEKRQRSSDAASKQSLRSRISSRTA